MGSDDFKSLYFDVLYVLHFFVSYFCVTLSQGHNVWFCMPQQYFRNLLRGGKYAVIYLPDLVFAPLSLGLQLI